MRAVRAGIEPRSDRLEPAPSPGRSDNGVRRPGLLASGLIPAADRELGLDDETVIRAYELMLLARRLSERALKLSMQGRAPISIPCDGHEAAQVGSILALRP